VASLSQGRTAAAQCGLFTHKSVPVIFEPPCTTNITTIVKKSLSTVRSVKPAYNRTVGCRIIPVARTFRFIQILKFWLLMTPDHWGFRSFVLKTGCRSAQVPFKTSCTVLQFFLLII